MVVLRSDFRLSKREAGVTFGSSASFYLVCCVVGMARRVRDLPGGGVYPVMNGAWMGLALFEIEGDFRAFEKATAGIGEWVMTS